MGNKNQQQPQKQIDPWELFSKRLGGGESPSRSTSEAVGKGIRKYLLPLLAQGIDSWISNYKERGAGNEKLHQKVLNGETLSPSEQAQWGRIQHRYDDIPTPAPTAPETQGGLLGDVPNFFDPNQLTGANLAANARQALDDRLLGGFTAPSTADILRNADVWGDTSLPSPFTGANLANAATENLKAATSGLNPELEDLDDWRKSLFGGW
ncbi:MAG: hypothetical protein IKP64_09535 [Selenomonadaceae bacterium]|nr:hypothetical protein [Selenomonadaceae bacterium]